MIYVISKWFTVFSLFVLHAILFFDPFFEKKLAFQNAVTFKFSF